MTVKPNAQSDPAPSKEVSAAWALYLETTKHLSRDRYEEVEPRAWRRLKLKLKS